MFQRARVLLALLLGFSLIAGACGSDDGDDAAPAATTAAPAATTAAPAAEEAAAADSSDPIKLPIHNWSSQIAGVYAVGAMLESTGNSVEYISADSTLVYTSMCEGDMDLVHEVWEGAFGVAFMEQVDAGCVIDAATHDAKTREEWWYPSYIEDVCPGLPDWQALNACAEMFATPDSGGKGRFLGGPVDWLKGDQERVEGLEMDFIVENAGTAGALWAALEAASANQEPIVLFNWTPNFIEAMYDGKFIEFPTFADECRTDASWGLNPETTHDCGNPKDGYLKLGVWEGFPAKWPNAYAAVQNMNFTNLDIAQLAMYVDIDGMEPEDAAALWLAENCARWTGWSGADASACPAAPAAPAASGSDGESSVKAAFIYVGPPGDAGWTWAHDQGRQWAENETGAETAFVESVPEGTADFGNYARDFIDQGFTLIVGTSFGYMDDMEALAAEYPDVVFDHVSGYKANFSNFGNTFGRMYEPRYLSGMVAGSATTTNHLGYVAAFPIPEVIRGINAFTLGVREVNPDAIVEVVWTSTWFDPVVEGDSAQALLDKGADVIAMHQDSTAAGEKAEAAGARWVSYNSDMSAFAPNAYLTAPVWNWGPRYVELIEQTEAGTYEGGYYWGSMADGIVDLAPIADDVDDSVKSAVAERKQQILDGTFHPFQGPINGQDGSAMVAAGETMADGDMLGIGCFVEGVVGSTGNDCGADDLVAAFDANGDGTITIGVAAAGPRDDNGYYQSVVNFAESFSAANGFAAPIVSDNIGPAEAAQALSDLAQQGVDILMVGASEIAEPLADLTEQFPDIFWYCNCGAGFQELPGLAQAVDWGAPIHYTAGVAMGAVLAEQGSTQAVFLGCCDINFERESYLGTVAGLQSVDESFTMEYVGTGDYPYDFDNSANATAALTNAHANGATLAYAYLGGALESVGQLATELGVAVFAAGPADICSRDDGIAWTGSVVFDGGRYASQAIRQVVDGTLGEGSTLTFGTLPGLNGGELCNASAEAQALLDAAFVAVQTDGELLGVLGGISGEAYSGG